ncbi:MAG: XdhC family protein [Alphaproteobacteria bacterium]
MKAEVLDRLVKDRAGKRPVALLTNLKSYVQILFYQTDNPSKYGVSDTLAMAARQALADDRSTTVDTPEGPVFIHVHNPPLRLLIVGAVHIAEPLARMAVVAGYAVTVIDPRRAFAGRDRFPEGEVRMDWPDEALKELAPDSRTAVVSLTHDPKLDDAALEVALKSPAFYIGALGSKKTHAARCRRLAGLGFEPRDIERIHGPVGLALGAETPAEIALSILAEITQVRRQGEVGKAAAA